MKQFLLFFLLLPFLLKAQNDTVRDLREVEVLSSKTGPFSQEVVLTPNLEGLEVKVPEVPLQLSTTQNLNLSPGIAAFDGTAGTAKFSYRGMGARTQYTTSRTLIYLDEIPITSIQGFSSFEDLNPLWVPSLVFIDEPGQSFPLALGGVLKYQPLLYLPEMSYQDTVALHTELNFGPFDLLQSNSLVQIKQGNLSLLAGYENTSKTGWRDNNSLQRQSLFFNTKWDFSDHQNLQLIAYGLKNRVEIPSSLSKEDFEENPEQAAEGWGHTEGYKEYDRLITGLTYSGGKPRDFTYKVTAFYRYLDNFEPRPFNILTEKRHSGGLRFRMRKDSISIDGANAILSSFGEYQVGNEDASTFENRYDSSDNSYNNIGANLNNNVILGQRFNGGITLQTEFKNDRKDNKYWVLQTGANAFYQYNEVRGDDEENYDVPFILAPLATLRYINRKKNLIVPKLSIYRSFSVPSLEENLDPDGSLNRDLKPELAWTGEMGLDWQLNKAGNLVLDLTYYYTEVENLIVPRVVGPDQVIATNSGSSRHTGLEFQLSNAAYVPADKHWAPHFILSGYYGSFSYLEFSDTAGSFSGNELPGFPEWQVNASFELKYDNNKAPALSPFSGEIGNSFEFSLGFLGRYTSGYFVNDENTVETEPYFLLQSWLRAERTFGKHFTASANFGIRNLTDTQYASMTVVNNQAFGGGSPRFYYPGQPVNWFGGVGLTYKW